MDHAYALTKLHLLVNDLDSYTAAEFWRHMSRIAVGATGRPHAEALEIERNKLLDQLKALAQAGKELVDSNTPADNGVEAEQRANFQSVVLEAERLCQDISDRDEPPSGEWHSDDQAVMRFSHLLREKMARSRAKGRDGWDDKNLCSAEMLSDMLIGHISKGNAGNFEDIATLAMMLQQRGENPSELAEALGRHDDEVRTTFAARASRECGGLQVIVDIASTINHFEGLERRKRLQAGVTHA